MEVFLNMRLRQSFWTAIIALTAVAAPLAAHHSFAAEYDGSKQVTMSGKVTKVEWMNPHAFFYVDVKDEKTGQVTNWAFELNSPNYLMRSGWTKSSLKVDDLVTVQVFCSDVSLFDKWNGVYRSYFKKDFPARAFIGSGKLLFDAHFEMQGTAVKGGEAALKKKLPEPEAQHGN